MDTANEYARTSRDMWMEDLAALAAYEFHTAQTGCVACHDYHSLWGYLRLTGITGNSFQSDRDILAPLLHAHTPPNGRVLIAGAADAGLLSLAAEATQARTPALSVADRCATPLAVCRRYAEERGIALATFVRDLTREELPSTHDLAFAHNILMLIPRERHVAFLRNLHDALAPGGTLLLVNRERPQGWVSNPPAPDHYATRVLDALTARGVTLPESETDFRRRLEVFSAAQHMWSDAVVDLPHVETALAEAEFEIVARTSHERRRTAPDRDGGQPRPMTTHIFAAKPKPARAIG